MLDHIWVAFSVIFCVVAEVQQSENVKSVVDLKTTGNYRRTVALNINKSDKELNQFAEWKVRNFNKSFENHQKISFR